MVKTSSLWLVVSFSQIPVQNLTSSKRKAVFTTFPQNLTNKCFCAEETTITVTVTNNIPTALVTSFPVCACTETSVPVSTPVSTPTESTTPVVSTPVVSTPVVESSSSSV